MKVFLKILQFCGTFVQCISIEIDQRNKIECFPWFSLGLHIGLQKDFYMYFQRSVLTKDVLVCSDMGKMVVN